MRLTIVLLGLFLCSCIEAEPASYSRNNICSVYEFEAENEVPVCAIRCAGREGYNGWDSLLPVDCSWLGKKLTVSHL